jgi:hypothetical protein
MTALTRVRKYNSVIKSFDHNFLCKSDDVFMKFLIKHKMLHYILWRYFTQCFLALELVSDLGKDQACVTGDPFQC